MHARCSFDKRDVAWIIIEKVNNSSGYKAAFFSLIASRWLFPRSLKREMFSIYHDAELKLAWLKQHPLAHVAILLKKLAPNASTRSQLQSV